MLERKSSQASVSSDDSKSVNSKMARKIREQQKQQSPALVQALSHVKEFMTDSQKAHILLREGKIYVENGDYTGAIECFNEAVSLNPTIVSIYTSRANAHKALYKFKEAYFDYSFAIRLEPDCGSHYCSRGLCLVKLKKLSMALEDLDYACQLELSVLHLYSRASLFLEYGKLKLAIKGNCWYLYIPDAFLLVDCFHLRFDNGIGIKSFNRSEDKMSIQTFICIL